MSRNSFKFTDSGEKTTCYVEAHFNILKLNKEISDFSWDDMLKINSFIAEWYKKWVGDIDKIKDSLLKTWWFDITNETLTIIIASVILYYLNNNFYNKLEDLLVELGIWNLDVIINILNNLLNKYQNTDKYFFINNHCQWIFFYKNLKDKEKLLNNTNWIKTISESSIQNTIIEIKKINSDSPYWFNYFNTLVSYTNYELAFVNNNSKIVKEYIKVLLEFINNLDIDISSENSVVKIVYINNLYILYNLSKDKKILEQINNFRKDFVDYKFNRLKTFSSFYWWIYNIWKKETSNISFSGLCVLDDNIEKIALSYVLAHNAPIITIKNVSSVLYEYLKNKEQDLFYNNNGLFYSEINSIQDNIFFDLLDNIDNIKWFDYNLIDYLVKTFLIEYLWLNVNGTNLNYKIYWKEKINKRIIFNWTKYTTEKVVKDKDKILLELKHNWYRLYLELYINWKISSDKIDENFKLYNRKFNIFFGRILYKLYKLSHFFDSIDTKINLIRQKHPETIVHMFWVAKLMHLLYNDLSFKDQNIINNLKDTLPVSTEDFFKVLWFLHDIWKVYNLDNMLSYNRINIRIDPYKNFIKLFNILLWPWFNWNDVNNADKDNISFGKIKELVFRNIDIIKEDHIIMGLINVIFSQIKEFNISSLLTPVLWLNTELLDIILLILDKIEIENFKIVNNQNYNLIKQSIEKQLIYIKNIQEQYSDPFEIPTTNIDLDKFVIASIVLFEIFSSIQVKEITKPHITYWLQFFLLFPKFWYLSSVLYHHINYPDIKEIEKYNWDKHLNMVNAILWKDTKYYDKNDMYIKSKNKDLIMVLTYVSDIIDALLANRKYQNSLKFDQKKFESIFSSSFCNYLQTIFEWEKLESKEDTFNKIIYILDRELKDNLYYKNIRNIITKKKDDLIQIYNKKWER